MYELRCSYFATATAIVFDDIDSGKARVLPLSKFIELVKTHGEYFHGENLVIQIYKADPNKCGSLDCSDFVMWYVEDKVSLESI